MWKYWWVKNNIDEELLYTNNQSYLMLLASTNIGQIYHVRKQKITITQITEYSNTCTVIIVITCTVITCILSAYLSTFNAHLNATVHNKSLRVESLPWNAAIASELVTSSCPP